MEGEEDVEMEDKRERKQKTKLFDRSQLLQEFGDYVIPISVSVGTYSSTLCVFVFPLVRNKDIESDSSEETLFPIMSVKNKHSGSIDQISTSGKFLFTCGYDEKIFQFDMKENREMNLIHVFEGTITSISIVGGNNSILVGSDNGVLSLFVYYPNKIGYRLAWRKSDHKGSISCISVHKSNKLFVSTCTKGKMNLYSLISGKRILSMNLRKRCSIFKWLKFDTFVMIQEKTFSIYRMVMSEDTQKTEKIVSVNNDVKISALEIINEFCFIIGDEIGNLRIWSISSDNELELLHEIKEVHRGGRVKDIKLVEVNMLEYLIFVVGDNGMLSVWRLKNTDILKLQYSKNWNVRFLSLGINNIGDVKLKKVVAQEYYTAKMRMQVKPKIAESNDSGGKVGNVLNEEGDEDEVMEDKIEDDGVSDGAEFVWGSDEDDEDDDKMQTGE